MDGRAAFDRAADLIGKDDAAAAAAFVALADAHPDGDLAADSLLEAAQLSEERLRQPERARGLYQRLLDRYPSSRLTLRARARRDFLVANLRTGEAALIDYQDVLLRYSQRPPDESIRRMEQLLVAHPDFVLADRALLWLGHQQDHAGHAAAAERTFLDVERRYPGTPVAREARQGRAAAALHAGHALAARRLYTTLLGDRDLDGAARQGLAATARALRRLAAFLASLAFLAIFLVAQLLIARRHLRPLPLELKFYLPVAALFVAAAATENGAITAAVAEIAAVGALLTWVTVAAARRRPTRPHHLLPLPVAIAALLYAALHANNLVDFLLETLKNGTAR